jgi:hypothetical protein
MLNSYRPAFENLIGPTESVQAISQETRSKIAKVTDGIFDGVEVAGAEIGHAVGRTVNIAAKTFLQAIRGLLGSRKRG